MTNGNERTLEEFIREVLDDPARRRILVRELEKSGGAELARRIEEQAKEARKE